MLLRIPPHPVSRSFALGVTALALAGCPGSLDASFDIADGGGAGAVLGANAACPDIPSTVFAATCSGAGCHGATSPANGLDLASPNVGARLIGKASSMGGALLDPAFPSRSVLYTKLAASPPFGARMPLGSAPLDDAALACVSAWVASLAPPSVQSGVVDSGAMPAQGAPDAGAQAMDSASPTHSFSPRDLPSTVLWLDAAQGVTTSGTRVSGWRDQSQMHNDGAQGSDGNRPSVAAAAAGGLPALRFEESRETFLSIPDSDSLRWGLGGFAVSVVAANRKATAGRRHGGGVSTVFAKQKLGASTEITLHLNWFTGESTDDDGKIHMGIGEGNPGQQSASGGYNDGTPRVYTARVAPSGGGGTDYQLFVNGKPVGSTHANGAVDVSIPGSVVRIGSTYGQSVEGDVSEVVAIKGAPSDDDLAKLNGYLIAKYGIKP